MYYYFVALLGASHVLCHTAKVQLSLCLTKHHATKTYRGVQVSLQEFLTSH